MKNLILVSVIFFSFSFVNSQTDYSYFQTCNITKAPLGLAFFVHKKYIGFFGEFKIGGFRAAENAVKNWSPQIVTSDYSYYPWETNYGSYEYNSGSKKVRYGTVDKHRIFNLGISTTFNETINVKMKVFIGAGLCRIKRETIEESQYFSHSSLNLVLADYYETSSDFNVYYNVINKEYINKLNITGGFIFEWSGGGSLGFGFDSSAIGLNIMAGFNF